MSIRMSGRAVVLCVAIGLSSCQSFQIPKDYLPDAKLVFLTQNPGLTPISYKPEAADPYVFAPDTSPLDQRPAFLSGLSWAGLLRPDFKADSRFYRSVEAYFGDILKDQGIKELREALDAAKIVQTPALPPDRGDQIKTYSNGGLYQYPGFEGAQITVLEGGYYEVLFPDKGYFRHQADGTYERVDGAGKLVFAFYPKRSQIVSTMGGLVYTSDPHFRELKGPTGTLSYT
ncbi:MAG TPA: hypothetical protein VFL04_02630, partial [Rectinemataceae bacterium]|nr:hypothetical protein [Rectinemataceae bacterium]